MERKIEDYLDIIDLPYYEPKNHKRMSMENRAAQFSPFAALSGFKEEIMEASRFTNKKIELSEDELEIVNYKIEYLIKNMTEEVTITYFVKDLKKEGGKYKTITGYCEKIDKEKRIIYMKNQKIDIDDVLDISSNSLIDLEMK